MLPGRYLRRLGILKDSFSSNIHQQQPRRTFIKRSSMKIGVQSANFNKGQRKSGVDQGPDAVLKTGFIESLREIGVDVEDRGSIQFHPHPDENFPKGDSSQKRIIPAPLRNTLHVGSANKAISDSTSRMLKDGRVCLTLGGDHSIAIGTVSGAAEVYNDLALLWVDAHADLNTPNTTWTGNFHGMPMGFLIEEMQPFVQKLDHFSWLVPRIKAKNVAYIGLRDVDPYEREAIDSLGILTYSMVEIQDLGIETVIRLALHKITDGLQRPLHLSFDIDALDDLEAKSTGTPVPGGLTLREGLTICERVGRSGNLVSMDLVEVNPLLGTPSEVDRTLNTAKQVLVNTFGYYRGGISTSPLPKP